MNIQQSSETRLSRALAVAREQLLAQRCSDGYWVGELSSSALSTATAVTALALSGRARPNQILTKETKAIEAGIHWLGAHANSDGGWGDTTDSPSNLSTTTLCWAAFGAVPEAEAQFAEVIARTESYLERAIEAYGGSRGLSSHLAETVIASYGKDRTFSAPILTMCALSGRLGSTGQVWRHVAQLPFELAVLPQSMFAALRLPVVSYALPALIAVGYARHVHRPTRNPMTRLVRHWTAERALNVLGRIQPTSGGYLEATPLTSFVLMSLAGSGKAEHPVARRATEFLLKSQRPDGSWPIDSNLTTWLTTLSINALGASGFSQMAFESRQSLAAWLLRQQFRSIHPYTGAAPGGWAWTDLPGGVPDADDTAGAALALAQLSRGVPASFSAETLDAAAKGVRWLLGLQNRDGGIPTFCSGWGTLPFDRSSPDLTGHALKAWAAWKDQLSRQDATRTAKAVTKAVHFLARSQRADGAWLPLWFGNQFAPNLENPTYGTSRVVDALSQIHEHSPSSREPLLRGLQWLLGARKADGSWGGAPGTVSSVEETALAVEGLASALNHVPYLCTPIVREVLDGGAQWLAHKIETQNWTTPAPIGLYFARLWYSEKLYPLIFTVAALTSAQSALTRNTGPG